MQPDWPWTVSAPDGVHPDIKLFSAFVSSITCHIFSCVHLLTPFVTALLLCLCPAPPPPADFEYEVAWQGLASIKFNRWIARAELIEKGFRKFVVEYDQRLAALALGNDARPLSKETITKFLQDFGLEPEFGVHSNIRGLSGGAQMRAGGVGCAWM